MKRLSTRQAVLSHFEIDGDRFESAMTIKLPEQCYVMVAMAGFAGQQIPLSKIGNLICALEGIDPNDEMAKQLRREKSAVEEYKLAADTARYEAVAREHGADLSEEGFNGALRKLGRPQRE